MRHLSSPSAVALVLAVFLIAPGAALADEGTPPPQSQYTEVRPCIVPALRGKTLRQAKVAIVKAGCKVGVVRKRVALKPLVGKVVAQSPARGKRLKGGTRVGITLGRAAP